MKDQFARGEPRFCGHGGQPRDVVLRRDLGVALIHIGQPGKAIDHLRFYLDQAPEADDYPEITKLLKHAAGRLAQWN